MTTKAQLEVELAKVRAEVARVTVLLTATQHQLHFWHEQSRTLENQMRVWQSLYMQTLNHARQIHAQPEDIDKSLALAQRALDAQPAIEDLIRAVSLASCGDRVTMRRLFPQLAALDGPVTPPTQLISNATGDRTPVEIVDEKPAKTGGISAGVKRLVGQGGRRNRARSD